MGLDLGSNLSLLLTSALERAQESCVLGSEAEPEVESFLTCFLSTRAEQGEGMTCSGLGHFQWIGVPGQDFRKHISPPLHRGTRMLKKVRPREPGKLALT